MCDLGVFCVAEFLGSRDVCRNRDCIVLRVYNKIFSVGKSCGPVQPEHTIDQCSRSLAPLEHFMSI